MGMQDKNSNLDIAQFGGQTGMGTEHMMVCLLDRILKLLDQNNKKSAVLMSGLDWSSAFDPQDPTIAIE